MMMMMMMMIMVMIIIIIIIITVTTYMPKPVCEEGDVTVLWNQAVHTDREVTANRTDIIIRNRFEALYFSRCVASFRRRHVLLKYRYVLNCTAS